MTILSRTLTRSLALGPALAACLTLAQIAFAQVALAPPAWAQAVFPPGTGIGLVPPDGMVPSRNFAGFESVSSGASILTVEMPAAAYAEIAAKFTPEAFAPSGLRASGPAVAWSIAGGEGKLMRGLQTARGVTYRKWVVLAKNRDVTGLVTVQAPETSAAALPDAAIEASLRTIAFRDTPGIEEQIAALPFGIGDRAGFRPVSVLSGSVLLLTEGPLDTVRDASQPLLVVAGSLGVSAAPDPAGRAAFARQAFMALAGLSDIRIESEADDAGAGWSRIEGGGVQGGSGQALYIAQMIRFAPGGYVRVVAMARAGDRDRFAARFRRVGDAITTR